MSPSSDLFVGLVAGAGAYPKFLELCSSIQMGSKWGATCPRRLMTEEWRGEGIRGGVERGQMLNTTSSSCTYLAQPSLLSLPASTCRWQDMYTRPSPGPTRGRSTARSCLLAAQSGSGRSRGDTFGMKLREQLELVNFVIYGLNPTCFVIIMQSSSIGK